MSRTNPKSSRSASDHLDQRLTELERKQAELELELMRERSENQRLRVNNGRLQRLLEQLREENEKLKRESLRQATPFARGKRVEVRKRPGRSGSVPTAGKAPAGRPDEESASARLSGLWRPVEGDPPAGTVCDRYSQDPIGDNPLHHVQWLLREMPSTGEVASPGTDF